MAHWYSIYHREEYEAEIQVGVYDYWLRQLDFGPTQADRVLNYTDMMEHAQERRFAVTEARLDISNFDMEHSQRIRHTIDHLQTHFQVNMSHEAEDAEPLYDDALIGLAPVSSHDRHPGCTQFATAPTEGRSIPMQFVLQWLSSQSQPGPSVGRPGDGVDELLPDVGDAIDDAYNKQVLFKEIVAAVRNRSGQKSLNGARQKKDIRARRSIIHPANKGFQKTIELTKDSESEYGVAVA